MINDYDDSGNHTALISYSGDEITSRHIYELDEHGNRIKVTRIFSSDSKKLLKEYGHQLYTVKQRLSEYI